MQETGSLELENELANIWREVLQRPDPIADSDSFFELGGDSMMMMMMMFKVQQKFGVEPQPEQFYEDPTLSGVARTIRDTARANDGSLKLSL